jgi:hypothetical protein
VKRALVVLFLVAACGGSSGGSKADTKASYVAKAEAVCAKANTQLADAKKTTPTAVAGIPPYVHKLLDIARSTLSDLTALSPPSKDAVDVKAKLLDPLGQQLADGTSFAAAVDAAAKSGDNAKLTQLVFNPPTKTRVDLAWMRSYGFKACVTAADTGAAAGK